MDVAGGGDLTAGQGPAVADGDLRTNGDAHRRDQGGDEDGEVAPVDEGSSPYGPPFYRPEPVRATGIIALISQIVGYLVDRRPREPETGQTSIGSGIRSPNRNPLVGSPVATTPSSPRSKLRVQNAARRLDSRPTRQAAVKDGRQHHGAGPSAGPTGAGGLDRIP